MIYICTAFHLTMLDKKNQKVGSPHLRFPVSITVEQARDYVKDFRYCSNVRSAPAVKTLSGLLGINLDLYTSFENKKLAIDDNILIGTMVPFNFNAGFRTPTPSQVDIEWWLV